MRFDVISLFPELFEPHLTQGVTRRAFESKQVDVRLWQLRNYASNAYRRIDDRPFGGGPGMVMLAEPLERALVAIRADRGEAAASRELRAPLVMFTPVGRRLDQGTVEAFAADDASVASGAILLCGRYEGVDQRFIDRHVDIEISVGDFVLSGGELAALILLDAVARLQEGVLNDVESHRQDSFSDGLLDCPHYSRPELLQTADGELGIPAVLKSGNHADIARWRREQSLALTASRRPDLILAARAAGRLSRADESYLARCQL
ncbi:tRNA (guanosine(37)-N1)-methyltransferase TrmD [soil metagenome]